MNPVRSVKYPTAWPNYGLDWSQNSANFCSLATSSFKRAPQNNVQVVAMKNKEDVGFSLASKESPIDYVCTKVLWSPSKVFT